VTKRNKNGINLVGLDERLFISLDYTGGIRVLADWVWAGGSKNLWLFDFFRV